jgi:hypothetical protein
MFSRRHRTAGGLNYDSMQAALLSCEGCSSLHTVVKKTPSHCNAYCMHDVLMYNLLNNELSTKLTVSLKNKSKNRYCLVKGRRQTELKKIKNQEETAVELSA